MGSIIPIKKKQQQPTMVFFVAHLENKSPSFLGNFHDDFPSRKWLVSVEMSTFASKDPKSFKIPRDFGNCMKWHPSLEILLSEQFFVRASAA